eukprot:Tamp_29452.p1 GENE.Tamp_29452~~Tamp_29452.p1  ORF type:complete len:201 (+),score=17.02 Tamp_29452:40-642(+)
MARRTSQARSRSPARSPGLASLRSSRSPSVAGVRTRLAGAAVRSRSARSRRAEQGDPGESEGREEGLDIGSGLLAAAMLGSFCVLVVLLDEIAQCADYFWAKTDAKIILVLYVGVGAYVCHHAAKHGFHRTIGVAHRYAVLIMQNQEGIIASIIFFVLVMKPLANKIKDVDAISVAHLCPLPDPCPSTCQSPFFSSVLKV